MSSQSHANHVRKENKKLCSSYKSKRFTKYDRYSTAIYSKQKSAPRDISTSNIDKQKHKRELQTYLLSFVMIIGITISIFSFLTDKWNAEYLEYKKFHQSYKESVKDGYLALHSMKLYEAERYFRNGLYSLPKGKSAYLGYTESVILICKHEGIFCEEAKNRLNFVSSSNVSDEEKQKLICIAEENKKLESYLME